VGDDVVLEEPSTVKAGTAERWPWCSENRIRATLATLEPF